MDIINNYKDWSDKAKQFINLKDEIIDKCVDLVISKHGDLTLHQYIGADYDFRDDETASDEEILKEYFDSINHFKFYEVEDLH